MKKKNTLRSANLVVLCFLLFISARSHAQFFPATDDTLNFTSVLFEFPWVEGAQTYELVVNHASGKGNLKVTTEANKVLISGLKFNERYSWKVRGITAMNEQRPWSAPIPFHIGTSNYIDSELYRYEGKKIDRSKATKGLLFLDYGKVGINKAGKPIWFLPQGDSLFAQTRTRDLKMTRDGTFTAICGESAIEFDRLGNILWMAPDDGTVNGEEREHYHHDFTKLDNGNYMVLGLDHVKRALPNESDSVEIEFGTVIEYNPEGRVVWCWNSKDYFSNEDLVSRKRGDQYSTRTHMNACSVFQNEVYVGFRDISRMVVIDKKTKKVVQSYGGYGVFEEEHAATGFFRRQHDALRLADGNFVVLNNDSIMDPSVVSSVVIFTRMKDGVSQKIMDFKLNFDELTDGKSAKTGNVNELPNGNLCVNLGSIPRFIELTRTGEVVWSMFAEQYDEHTQNWKIFPQYRVFPSPSLYPYAFTAKLVRNSLKKRNREVEVKLYNVGTVDDFYTVRLMKKNRIVKEVLVPVPSEHQKEVVFRTKSKSAFTVEIQSSEFRETQSISIASFK